MVLSIDDPKFLELVEKGIPLDELENRLRPRSANAPSEISNSQFTDFSENGFIGQDEDLLERVYLDWEILDQHGVTHGQIADRMSELIKAGGEEINRNYADRQTIAYKIAERLPRRIREKIIEEYDGISKDTKNYIFGDFNYLLSTFQTLGVQSCPWGCRIVGQNAGMIYVGQLNIDQVMRLVLAQASEEFRREDSHTQIARNERGKSYLPLTGILPHLIGEHHFFEGVQSPYRADPGFLIKAFGLGKK